MISEINTRGQRIFAFIGGAVFGLVMLLLYAPFFVIGAQSFQERATALFPPKEFTLISYRKLFNPDDFSLFRVAGEPIINYGEPLQVSLVLGMLTAIVATALALAAALAFRNRFPAKGVLFYFLLLGMLVPGISLGLGARLFVNMVDIPARWYTTGILVHVAWTMPFGFIVFLIFLNRYDKSVEEAASMLGASPFKVFRTITLPMLRPAIMGSLLFAFTLSFDEVQRSALVLGRDQNLPLELLASTTVRISPVVYALGTLIAFASLLLVFVYLIMFERQRRKFYGGSAVALEEDEQPG